MTEDDLKDDLHISSGIARKKILVGIATLRAAAEAEEQAKAAAKALKEQEEAAAAAARLRQAEQDARAAGDAAEKARLEALADVLAKAAAREKKEADEAKTASEAPVELKMSFWQHRALNRKQFDGLVIKLFNGFSPRNAINNMATLPANGQPKEPCGWWEYIVVPEYYIWRHSDEIAGGLPGSLPSVLLGRCIDRFIYLFRKLGLYGKEVTEKENYVYVMGQVGGEVFGPIFVWFHMNLWCPIIPWFLCDLSIYFTVYIFPILVFIGQVMWTLYAEKVQAALQGALEANMRR